MKQNTAESIKVLAPWRTRPVWQPPAKGVAAHRAPPQAKMRTRVETTREAEKCRAFVPRIDPEDQTNHILARPQSSARSTSGLHGALKGVPI